MSYNLDRRLERLGGDEGRENARPRRQGAPHAVQHAVTSHRLRELEHAVHAQELQQASSAWAARRDGNTNTAHSGAYNRTP